MSSGFALVKMMHYKVNPADVEYVKGLIADFVAQLQPSRKGLIRYEAYQENDVVSFLHLMEFSSQLAEEAHRTNPQVREFIERLIPCCTRQPLIIPLESVCSK